MTLDELESLLRSEIEGAIAEGWTLRRGAFFWPPRECCALGAAVRHCAPNGEHGGGEAQRLLRWLVGGAMLVGDAMWTWRTTEMTDDLIADIALGFDGKGINDLSDKRYYDLGVRLARIYIDGVDE